MGCGFASSLIPGELWAEAPSSASTRFTGVSPKASTGIIPQQNGSQSGHRCQQQGTLLVPILKLAPRSLDLTFPIVQKEGQDLIAFNSSKVLLGSLCQMRDFGKSIFPSASTLEVVQGSYFLQMSTQEGRQALVIFPPGSQSIKDIKYMKGLESDDEMDDETKTLKRATLSGSGGCKFLLKPYS